MLKQLKEIADKVAMDAARVFGFGVGILLISLPLAIMWFFRYLFSGQFWRDVKPL